MPRIDRKLLSKKDYVVGSLRKIIKAENIIDHEDQTRPFETDALSAYKQKPLAVVFPENTNEVSRIALPEELSKNGEHFGLKISGDSMIEAGINDGDTIIVKKTNTANNGQIVVALIDGHEAMLKRKRKKGKVVALESANKRYETKIFGPNRVKVQGVLVSLYRNF